MTEPQGGADPKVFTTTAVRDGDEWVINGEKWFSSHAKFSSFLIVMAVTDPDNPPYQQMSMFIVPTDTPGVEIIRNVGLGYQESGEGTHAYMRYTDVRVPAENMLGDRGGAFVVAQTRLGGGRIHHAMRTVGQVQKAFDMMCERAVSRTTQGELLGKKQMVQEMVADCWIEIEQFRLLVLRTAWRIDKYKDYKQVRKDISAVKAAMPKVFHDVAVAGAAGPRLARRVRRDAVLGDGHRVVPHGPRRRADRGAQGDGRPPGAQRVPAGAGAVPDGPHPDPPRRRARPSTPTSSSARSSSCDRPRHPPRPPPSAPARSSTGRRSRRTCAPTCPSCRATSRRCSSRTARPTSPTCCASATPSSSCGARRSARSRRARTT